jgi:plastocyanin
MRQTAFLRNPSGWRGLAVGAALATTVVIIVTVFVTDLYPLLISAVLLVIGAGLTRRPGRAGPIVLAVVALLFLLVNGPFVAPYLAVPASWLNFILTAFALLGCLVTLIAAVAALRKGDRATRMAPIVAWGGLGLAVLLVGVGAVAGIGYHPAAAQHGDIQLSAADLRFSKPTLRASSGTVSVFVSNHDRVLHTFTIDKLHVNLNIPASSSGRVTFPAGPGSYRYICTLHADTMSGTLVVH